MAFSKLSDNEETKNEPPKNMVEGFAGWRIRFNKRWIKEKSPQYPFGIMVQDRTLDPRDVKRDFTEHFCRCPLPEGVVWMFRTKHAIQSFRRKYAEFVGSVKEDQFVCCILPDGSIGNRSLDYVWTCPETLESYYVPVRGPDEAVKIEGNEIRIVRIK